MIERRVDPGHAYRPTCEETMTDLALKRFQGLRLVNATVDIVAGIGLEMIRLDVDGRISVEDRGVRTSYLVPDETTGLQKPLGKEVSVLTAEG